MKKAYLIRNIEEYWKFVAYLIEHDISTWRLYWDEKQKGDRCYEINWDEKRCYYARKAFYLDREYEIIIPTLICDKHGRYKYLLENGEVMLPRVDRVYFVVDKGSEFEYVDSKSLYSLTLYEVLDLSKYGYYLTKEEAEQALKGGAE